MLDNSEGAGLGIVILVLMMKKIGLTEECFKIDTEDGETVASITIPFSDVHLEQLETLTQTIVKEVETLPQFPDNIVNLQSLIADPDSEISAIAREISVDPSLTADLLKLVNSASFMLPKRVDNIVEAVKLVGTKGVRNLLYSYGTQKVLGEKYSEKYSEMRSLWQHSYRCGPLRVPPRQGVQAAQGDPRRRVRRGHPARPRPDRHRGDAPRAARAHHAGLQGEGHRGAPAGELLGRPQPRRGRRAHRAASGTFPSSSSTPSITTTSLTQAPAGSRDIVNCVYLANAICDVEREKIGWDQLETAVLHDFGIETREQFDTIEGRLAKAFEDQRARFQ